MSKYKEGQSRDQLVLFPDRLDSMVSKDNEVRVIDAFVESLDMKKLGFEEGERKKVGAPGYNPKDMLKLYLYGYVNKVRSSRKLMKLTKTNVEVMWLLKKLEPDFRCISDFRKDNIENLKEVFFQFNLVCKEIGILKIEKTSQDGTKIRAVNAKDKNFTLNKVDDRIKRIKEEINSILDDLAKSELEEISDKLIKMEELEARKERYESYKKEMEAKGVNQKSLTDKDAKLMKNNGAFEVCYNNQVQVDCKSHMVTNYEVTDKPADFGTMSSLIEESEKVYDEKIKINITDNGYSDRKDMMKLLENGTRPEVTPARGKESYILETEYEENEISEEELESKNPKDIKKCLKAGKVPKLYENSIQSIEVKERTRTIIEGEEEENLKDLTDEQKRDKAIEEYIFIRDKEGNKVFCPGGCILRQKAKYETGEIKYCNKLGCKNCKNPCTLSRFKEVKFSKDQEILIPKNRPKKEEKENEISEKNEDISNFHSDKKSKESEISKEQNDISNFCDAPKMVEEKDLKNGLENILSTVKSDKNEAKNAQNGSKKTLSTKKEGKKQKIRIKEKVVLIEYKIDKEELKERMSTSEHCHGTMKRNDDASYFLLKGLKKVNGEMALYYTASNIRRAINIVGVPSLIKHLQEKMDKTKRTIINNDNSTKNDFTFMKKYAIIYV